MGRRVIEVGSKTKIPEMPESYRMSPKQVTFIRHSKSYRHSQLVQIFYLEYFYSKNPSAFQDSMTRDYLNLTF